MLAACLLFLYHVSCIHNLYYADTRMSYIHKYNTCIHTLMHSELEYNVSLHPVLMHTVHTRRYGRYVSRVYVAARPCKQPRVGQLCIIYQQLLHNCVNASFLLYTH
jgi:hypothetical protein